MEQLMGVEFAPDRQVVPGSPKKDVQKEGPVPKKPDVHKGTDRLMDRMKKVDPNQSERYRQRTGE
ncbi:MAG: ubiquitin-like protein UBact [Leptospirales bacterium]